MKKLIILSLLLIMNYSVLAQETSVQIKVSTKQNEDYWIEVADRNCGAQSNGIDAYGNYYSWSDGQKSKDRITPDQAAKACMEFRAGGYDDWRLPTQEEIWALMEKCETHSTYASLKSERGDLSQVVYFPYAGYIETNNSTVQDLGTSGFYWTANGLKRSSRAVALQFSNDFMNNPQVSKKTKHTIRCVRTVED